MMKEQLLSIKKAAEEKLSQMHTVQSLEDIRIRVLGKKGELTQVLRQMGSLSAEERPVIGALANDIRTAIENAIAEKRNELLKAEREQKLKDEVIDVTMAGKRPQIGGLHQLQKS